jgi:glycerophosphoryl diester phosphodiesterase
VRRAGIAALIALAWAVPAQASPFIHAHRGGPLLHGVPAFGENTMAAFRNAAAQGFVLEADVKLTADRQPVIFHDPELDRASNCSGPIAKRTLAELRRNCRVDILGTAGNSRPAPDPQPIPTLGELLDLLKATPGERLNLEIKNQPLDSDFDPSGKFARTVVDAIAAAKVPADRLIVQSFYPLNLQVSEMRLPNVETSLLTLLQMNAGAPAVAKASGFEWVSPDFGTGALKPALVSEAHALGLRVVPYTIDKPKLVRSAVAAGVDELITNDPVMAREEIAAAAPPRPAAPAAPSGAQCAGLRATRSLPTIEAFDDGAGPRVFAMQFKQDPRHVISYASYRAKIECMVREHVVPRLATGRPNVVAFNEDVGLATIATGTRGKAARDAFAAPGSPGCEPQGVPCGTLAALGAVRAGYTSQLAAYRARFPQMSAIADSFVAPTDTFARGWMQAFSDIARRYGVYILGSNDQAPFRESTDPAEIALFADLDLPAPSSVFVATRKEAYNEVFMWGPQDVRAEGPWPLRNVVAQNKKVPLTPIELQLEIANGPSTGPEAVENVAPYALPGTDARIGFATSLPAFVYGDPVADPCADTAAHYMRCLDALGTNLVMQDEANPGRWPSQAPFWQPLEWMESTWRATSDPTVGFAYNVTPHMVGNLADLAFDGQTAITQRGLTGPGCHYVGDATWQPEDNPAYQPLAGPKPEFLALLPWVTADGDRAALRDTAAKLAPGSGDALENDYAEGAIAADLTFPPDPARAGCLTATTG